MKIPKFVAPGQPIPPEAKFHCRNCGLWVISASGARGHRKVEPRHVIINLKTNLPYGEGRGHKHPVQVYSNGNTVLNATARDLLLDYVLDKAKEELNSELDRMFRTLKSQPTGPARSRTFVAR